MLFHAARSPPRSSNETSADEPICRQTRRCARARACAAAAAWFERKANKEHTARTRGRRQFRAAPGGSCGQRTRVRRRAAGRVRIGRPEVRAPFPAVAVEAHAQRVSRIRVERHRVVVHRSAELHRRAARACRLAQVLRVRVELGQHRRREGGHLRVLRRASRVSQARRCLAGTKRAEATPGAW